MLVISLGVSALIDSNLFIVKGVKNRMKMIDVKKLASALGAEVTSALIGFHSWSGCDYVSDCPAKVRKKAIN